MAAVLPVHYLKSRRASRQKTAHRRKRGSALRRKRVSFRKIDVPGTFSIPPVVTIYISIFFMHSSRLWYGHMLDIRQTSRFILNRWKKESLRSQHSKEASMKIRHDFGVPQKCPFPGEKCFWIIDRRYSQSGSEQRI